VAEARARGPARSQLGQDRLQRADAMREWVAGVLNDVGKFTGVSLLTVEMMPKRIELLSELVPQASMIALLVNPNNASAEPQMRDVQGAARAKGPGIPPIAWSRSSLEGPPLGPGLLSAELMQG
jgi:hypothetical protein